MQAEIEAKFLAVDHEAVRAKLRELGATRVEAAARLCPHRHRKSAAHPERARAADGPAARRAVSAAAAEGRQLGLQALDLGAQLGDRGTFGSDELAHQRLDVEAAADAGGGDGCHVCGSEKSRYA